MNKPADLFFLNLTNAHTFNVRSMNDEVKQLVLAFL